MTTRATPQDDSRKAKQKRRRAPRSVPVASRDRARSEKDRAARVGATRLKSKPALFQRDIASLAILIGVLVLILLAVAVPLRNYYEGRGEIARAEASIKALEEEKQRLESDIARYQDKDFAEQEARRRLGVLAERETQWRIIDPRMSDNPAITTDEVPDTRGWTQVLWDSLRDDPELPEASQPAETQPSNPPAE